MTLQHSTHDTNDIHHIRRSHRLQRIVSLAGIALLVSLLAGSLLVPVRSASAAPLPASLHSTQVQPELAGALSAKHTKPALGSGSASAVSTSQFTGHKYYVSPTGTDAGSCSKLQPCASLYYASALTQPGDMITMLAGTYGPQMVNVNGTASNPIGITTAGTVTLTRAANPSDTVQNTALLTIINSNYVTVNGLTVIGMKGRSDVLPAGCSAPTCDTPYGGEVLITDHCAPSPGCSVTTGNGIVLQHLVVQNSENTGIKVEDHESGVTITSSTITNCGQNGLDHGIYDSGANAVITNNTISNVTGFGIHVYSAAGKSVDGALISGNTVTGAAYAGILDRAAATVTQNTVSNSGLRGMDLGPNSTVTFNTIFDNNTNPAQSQGYGILFTNMGNDDIENNTFYRDGASEIYNDKPRTGPITVKNNIFVGRDSRSHVANTGQLQTGDVFDYNDYFQIAAPPAGYGDADSIFSDPLLVNPVKNFALNGLSPAILPNGRFMGAQP